MSHKGKEAVAHEPLGSFTWLSEDGAGLFFLLLGLASMSDEAMQADPDAGIRGGSAPASAGFADSLLDR